MRLGANKVNVDIRIMCSDTITFYHFYELDDENLVLILCAGIYCLHGK